MTKPTVAVIFGSRSAEHDISIITAVNAIIKPLRLIGNYEIFPVYIAKDGRWFADQRLGKIDFYTSGAIQSYLSKTKPVALSFDNGLELNWTGLRSKRQKIDLVFPATHGTYGEDGSLQGLLRMANVPFVGCDLAASAIAMDKVLSRMMAAQAGIPQNKFAWFHAHEFAADQKAVLLKLGSLKYPLFVKPAHLGSSIAISRVVNQAELVNAIEVAMHYDDKVLIEEEVPNLVELTLPIIGNSSPRPALLEKPLTPSGEFFDFETKYMQGGKKGGKTGSKGSQGYSQIPADIPKEMADKARSLALRVYGTLGCEGIARVDMLVDGQTGKVFFNEVNPLPGSLYVHNWKLAGLSNVELVQELIDYAIERHQRAQKIATTFDTSFLQQF